MVVELFQFFNFRKDLCFFSRLLSDPISRLRNALESLARGSQKFTPKLMCKTVRYPILILNAPYCQYNSLPLVSKLKPTSPYYLPYLNAFSSIIVPAKKPIKKPAKQTLKLMLIMLTPLAAPLAGSTRSIRNTRAHLYTTSVAPKAPKAPTVNKHRKPSTPPPPLGLPKSD